jgi:hypothetical protein
MAQIKKPGLALGPETENHFRAKDMTRENNYRELAWKHMREGYRLDHGSPLARQVLGSFKGWSIRADAYIDQIVKSVPAGRSSLSLDNLDLKR